MKSRQIPLHLVVLVSLVLTVLPASAAAGRTVAPALQGKITFEEAIPQPEMVRSQYCNNASTNKGVEFLNHGGRIFTPSVTTSSPTHSLTNRFSGDEFGEFKRIQIRFTAGQSEVSVQAGLDRSYSFGVYAHMWAYSTDTPGGTPEALDNIQLGVGPTQVLHELKVTSASASIRSVEIWFGGPAIANAIHEIVDDLTYSTIGPPCISDSAAPTIQITKPATNGQSVQESSTNLAFTVTDNESGVAKIQVFYLNSADQVLSSFTACGGTGPLCVYDVFPSKVSFNSTVFLPANTQKIRVRAWDYADHMAQADRTISLVQIGYFNLWAQSMEITQAIQPWLPTNTQSAKSGTPPAFQYPAAPTAVPLVAGRTTVVRLYAGVAGTTNNQQLEKVRAQLYCFSNATFTIPCPGYKWINPQSKLGSFSSQITIEPNDTLDTRRRDMQKSWVFTLPKSWTQAGTIHLEARILPPLGLQECDGCEDAANRLRVSDIEFETVPNFQNNLVHFVRTSRKLGSTTFEPTQAQFDAVVKFLGRMYPVDETTLPTTQNGSWTFNDGGDTYDPDPKKNLKARCNDAYNDLKQDFPNKANRIAVYALLDNGFPCAGMGWAGYAYGRANRPDSFPHETGHAVNLNHAGPPPGHGAECNPWACDNWPWPHGVIDTFGFDVYNMTVVIPGITESDPHDFMSYGGNEWVSSRNWIRVFNAFTGQNLIYPTSAALPSTDAPQSDGLRYFLVRGEEMPEGGWALLPVYQMDPPTGADEEPDEGDYSVRLLGARGEERIARRFSVPMLHVDPDDIFESIPVPESFVLGLTPAEDDIAEVQLRRGGETLAAVQASEHAPSVEIISPTEEGFLGLPEAPYISWHAADEDEQPLHYMIQYSPAPADGQEVLEWQTLAVDWTEETFPVNPQDLPGSDQAMVRVLATDGLHTTAATSPAFALEGKPPVARILSPSDESTWEEGTPLTLVGAASDLEDGLLDPEALHWYADRYVPLGTGRRLNLGADGGTPLPPGGHLISLLAEDSEGLMNQASIYVVIEDRPNTQPLAHAGPDRSAGLNAAVRLDGSASEDPDGDPLIFDWAVTAQPVTGSAWLSDADTAFPIFAADTEGQYEVELVVHDGQIASLPDRLSIIVGGPGEPRVLVSPVESMIPVSGTATVELRVENVDNLYAAQVDLMFNPEVVQVVDAYEFLPGIQIEEGDFPLPEVVIRNQADNQEGVIQYAVSLQGDKPGVSGAGTLARITFHGRDVGVSPLTFTEVVLSDPQSIPIGATPEDGGLLVREVSGSAMGRVILERRASNAGAVVCVDDHCVQTSSDGSYILPAVPPGPRMVQVGRESYLRSWQEVDVPEGVLVLPDVTLLGGDVNGDDHIDELDGIATGLAWNTTPMDSNWNGSADVTDDGSANILDMVAVQFNFDQAAPGPWGDQVGQKMVAADEPSAHSIPLTEVTISPSLAVLRSVGQTVDLDIRVEDARSLYGGRIQIIFDPGVLQVLDADPGADAPGVQIRPGDFLDPANQYILANQADNGEGVIDYAVTQLHPAQARTGSGVLATLRFELVGEGSSAVHVNYVRLGDDSRPSPLEIATHAHDGEVTSGSQYTIYLPIGFQSVGP